MTWSGFSTTKRPDSIAFQTFPALFIVENALRALRGQVCPFNALLRLKSFEKEMF